MTGMRGERGEDHRDPSSSEKDEAGRDLVWRKRPQEPGFWPSTGEEGDSHNRHGRLKRDRCAPGRQESSSAGCHRFNGWVRTGALGQHFASPLKR
jgi:hypothetical protein